MTQGVAKSAVEGSFQSAEGLRIVFRSWQPDGRARGIVAIVPGFNSHSGYYDWAAGHLAATGLTVVAVDLRGRGKSDGERFYVTKFSDYVVYEGYFHDPLNDIGKEAAIADITAWVGARLPHA